MSIEDISRHLGMNRDTIKGNHDQTLGTRLKRHRFHCLLLISVGEMAVRKRHNCLTVIVELEMGEAVWVEKGRKTETLAAFLILLKRAEAKVEAIAMDL